MRSELDRARSLARSGSKTRSRALEALEPGAGVREQGCRMRIDMSYWKGHAIGAYDGEQRPAAPLVGPASF
jgi:hypothetical protein